jgi:hypothetical protein
MLPLYGPGTVDIITNDKLPMLPVSVRTIAGRDAK